MLVSLGLTEHMKRISAIFFIFFISACEFIAPQAHFKFALPINDHSYAYSAKHLKLFLEENGVSMEIIMAKDAAEANRMVAEGKADLTFVMNHSLYISETIGTKAGNLRTILPVYDRLFFLFAKDSIQPGVRTQDLLKNQKIAVSSLEGEAANNLKHLFASAKMEGVKIVQFDSTASFVHFWGHYYGSKYMEFHEKGWHGVSLDQDWIKFTDLSYQALIPFEIPALPGVEGSTDIQTLSVQTLLICNAEIHDKAIYLLAKLLCQRKVELVAHDNIYRSISENFDQSILLYPLHLGTDAYFRRDQPSFFERYSESIGLFLSVCAVLYGAFQTIRNRLLQKRKENIDKYFTDFVEIRGNRAASRAETLEKLTSLLQRAIVQVTTEKLAIMDFHIFSMLVQQEITILKSFNETK